MTRVLSLAAALIGSALLIAPVAAQAQVPAGPYYAAVPVAAPTKTDLITHSTVWNWNNTAFTANKAPERETVLCQLLVQHVGALSSFTVAGQPFDADALAKCNARAK